MGINDLLVVKYKMERSAGLRCNCVGPQNGDPVCPCRMRCVVVENGRYVEKTDLGPVEGEKILRSSSDG